MKQKGIIECACNKVPPDLFTTYKNFIVTLSDIRFSLALTSLLMISPVATLTVWTRSSQFLQKRNG